VTATGSADRSGVHGRCTPDPSPSADPFAAFQTDPGVALDRAKTQARGGR
jgi:hypothetical protein